jgi:predicted ATPase/class 3 adenylate cyclase/Tfp pilus assembly protein PilF
METRALLFTDVVDSTRAVERLGDEGAAALWAEHDRRARALLAPHGGIEIDRTDGFFLLFPDVDHAAAYALDYHAQLATLGLRARAAVHFGTVLLRRTPPEDIARGAKPLEVEGLAKPLAARIMALALGGQTLLSDSAHAALLDVPGDAAVERYGHYRLKGIETPVEIYEIGRRGAAPFVPPPDVEKAYRVLPVDGLWRPRRDVPHNLPAERDRFVGRGDDLRRLATLLDGGSRLVSVVGTGGAGKTRLARRYATVWLGDWPGGVYFCDLSEARTLHGLCYAVGAALEVPLGKDDPVLQLGHAIAARGRCLLILDNFEQLIEHAAPTVGRWLDRPGDAAFVVTSRERLHLPGEALLPLEPLPLQTDSVELFCMRAAAQRTGFSVDGADRIAVIDIVRLLDGLPLAIELAAARVGVLSLAQLRERLADRFRLLAGARGSSARQATLRNAIDWSWTLLAPSEQQALAQCAVFEGGFTLAAAESVLDLEPGAPSVLDVVQALVDKSLLRAEEGRREVDEPYFGMYVSVREYAREKLRRAGDRAELAAQQRHGLYFAAFGSDAAIEALSRADGTQRRRALAVEIDNLAAACRRSMARGDATTAIATYRAVWEVLELQGPAALAASLGSELLALPDMPEALRLIALATVPMPLQRSGRMVEAGRHLEQAIELAQRIGDRRIEGRARSALGMLHMDQGRVDEAAREFQHALALHRTTGDQRFEGAVLGNLGNLDLEQGRMEEARRHYEEALVVVRQAGHRRVEGSLLGNLGLLHYEQGRLDEAFAHYRAALAVHREVGSRRLEATVLGNLALLCFEQGKRDEARLHHEAALALHRAVGNRRDEGIVLANLGELHFALGDHTQAEDCWRLALAIAREVGYSRVEGHVLGHLGELLATGGRANEARLSLDAGQAILEGIGDKLGLGKLLCVRARVEHSLGSLTAARRALDEAEMVAKETSAGPESELGRELLALRSALS